MSGIIDDLLDHVFMAFLPLPASIFATFSNNFSSTKGPFLVDLLIVFYLLRLSLTKYLLVCFLVLVFLPLVFHPHGDFGEGMPIPLSLYEPPCGWSLGFA